jgi:hypothetical protein
MSKFSFATIVAATLLAAPAFAQSSPSTTPLPTTPTPTSPTATTPSAAGTQARETITSQLEKDGYRNVSVVADSFLVHATNKEGQSVVMIINPDSVFSMTDVGAANNAAKTAAK